MSDVGRLKHILRKPESVVRLRARPRCLSRMTATRWRCLAVFLALLPASSSEFDLALRGDRGPRPSGRRITRRKGTGFLGNVFQPREMRLAQFGGIPFLGSGEANRASPQDSRPMSRGTGDGACE